MSEKYNGLSEILTELDYARMNHHRAVDPLYAPTTKSRVTEKLRPSSVPCPDCDASYCQHVSRRRLAARKMWEQFDRG